MGNGNRYEIIEQNDKEVSIKFFNEIRKYKVVTNDDIKSMMDNGEDIILNNCYIKDFCYWVICGHSFYSKAWNNKAKCLNCFNAQRAFFDGDVDFRGAYFGDGDVNFSDARFGDGNVYFSDAHFGDGDVIFTAVQFGDGEVDFAGAHFGDGDVNFSDARFGVGYVNFIAARFGDGNVNFSNAQFGDGNVDFLWVEFGDGNVDFSHAQFGDGDVNFLRAQFGDGNVDFTYAQFGKCCLVFCPNLIKGSFFFNPKLCIETKLYIGGCNFLSPVSISIDQINHLFFNNCTNSDLLSINTSAEYSPEQKSIAFLNHTNLSTLKLNWDEIKDSVAQFDYASWVDKVYLEENIAQLIADEYVMLKESFHNQGRYAWEDEAYVEFKKIDTDLLISKRSKIGIWKRIKNFFKYCILKILFHIGKYGTDPFSVFKTMIMTVIAFGALYCLPIVNISSEGAARYWWSPIYYSAITFFTFGFGDLSAQNGWTAWLFVVEGFLGAFLMSYFSVAVVRKILR